MNANENHSLQRHLQNSRMSGLRKSVLRCVRVKSRPSGFAIGVSGEMPVFQSRI